MSRIKFYSLIKNVAHVSTLYRYKIYNMKLKAKVSLAVQRITKATSQLFVLLIYIRGKRSKREKEKKNQKGSSSKI